MNETAEQWADALLERLFLGDWGLPVFVISNRDPKFLGDFWKQIFCRLSVHLLYSTAYHPQTDGQSKRTNETIEIFLRYAIASLNDTTDWHLTLPHLQFILNSSPNAATEHLPHQLIYSIKLKDTLTLSLTTDPPDVQQFTTYNNAHKALKIAAIYTKHRYSAKHKAIYFKKGKGSSFDFIADTP